MQIDRDRRILEKRLVMGFRPRLEITELSSLVLLHFLDRVCCIGSAMCRLVETQRVPPLVEGCVETAAHSIL